MVDSSGGGIKKEKGKWKGEKKENGVTNHHATTIKRDTMNETLDQILPSKSGAGGRDGVEWGRNEVGEV